MKIRIAVLATAAAAALAGQARASLTYDFYAGIGGSAVSDLTSSPAYISHTPTSTSTLPTFETGTNIDDNYGSAVYGYFTPTVSGTYYFATASDDGSALYLSSDTNPGNAVLVAGINGWGSSRNYDSPEGGGAFHSGGIPLVGGASYYILGLQKEGGGGDNFAVTASLGIDSIANGQDPLGSGATAALGQLTTAPVPEPVTGTLAAFGLAGLVLRRRSR